MTITPNVGNSCAMAQYTGITSVDSFFGCLESKPHSKAELRKAAMRNDVASARVFMEYIDVRHSSLLASAVCLPACQFAAVHAEAGRAAEHTWSRYKESTW